MNAPSITPRLLIALLSVVFYSGAALAAEDLTKTVSKKKPVMLTADNVSYDEHHSVANASGHVEVIQGDTILFADQVTYDQAANTVHAIGHVTLVDESGEAFFSNEATLKDDLEQGVVKQFRARLKDNSLFAAREARKVNKQVTKLKNAVFSPCKVCQTSTDGSDTPSPLWQITAQKATIDENDKRVRYQNAAVDLYGVPVLYTPYFSHPTPDAPNQSGLLQPVYFHDSLLGSVVKEPLYYTFAPNLDMTLTPWYLSREHPLLEGEIRGLGHDGNFELRGAITEAHDRNSAGNIVPGEWTRGFVEAHGKLKLDDNWNAGLDAEHVSDNTFLQFYHFGWQDLLTSRLYAERMEGRNYFSVESLAFQGLQPQDEASVSPYILPKIDLHYESDPMFAHSRIQVDGNALVLQREQGDDAERLSSTAAWKLPYITRSGQVFEFAASLRGDAYHVTNQLTDPVTNEQFNGNTGRFIPQATIDWRYPFINRFGDGKSLMIAPVVELVASPNLHQTSNIPNEDSQVAELSDINLFSPDRFSGLDQVESGLRGTYGTRGQFHMADQQYIEWLFGQAYQENDTSPYPLAISQAAHYSDYIGRVALKYEAFDLGYSFRLDRQTLSPTSNEVNTAYTYKPFTFDITYLSLLNEPLFGDRKEVFGTTALDLSQNWTLTLGGRRDLGSSTENPVNTSLPISALNPLEPTTGTVGINSGLIFHNECMRISTIANRSYINQLDVKPSTTFGIVVVFKNFGAQNSSSSGALSSSNVTTIDARDTLIIPDSNKGTY